MHLLASHPQTRIFLALVLLATFLSTPILGQEPSQPPCYSCQGKGSIKLACMACEGKRKANCTDCSSLKLNANTQRTWRISFLAEGKTDAKGLGAHLAKLALISASSKSLGVLFDSPDGRLQCPGCSIINGNRKDCKICKKKGHVRCPGCKGKALGTCSGCSGKGQVQSQCTPCMGTGIEPKFPSLLHDAPPECGWCNGTQLAPCGTCVHKDKKLATCHGCQGRKGKVCGKCRGKKKMSCPQCLGRGISLTPDFTRSSNRCKGCKGKKILTCTACKSGKRKCGTCKGKGRALQECPDCLGQSQTPCPGCAGGQTLFWEAGAIHWQSQSNSQQHGRYLDQAIAHKAVYVDKFLEACDLATALLSESAAPDKGRSASSSRRFKEMLRDQRKWLQEHRAKRHRELRSGLTQLRKLREANRSDASDTASGPQRSNVDSNTPLRGIPVH